MQQPNQQDKDAKLEQVARLFAIFNGSSKSTPLATLEEYRDGVLDIDFDVVRRVVEKYKFKKIESHKTRFPPTFPDFYEQVQLQINLDESVQRAKERRARIHIASSQPYVPGQTPIEKTITRAKLENSDRQVLDENCTADQFKTRAKNMEFAEGSIWRLGVAYGPKGSK